MPPFTPLAAGEAIVEVPATVIEVGLSIAGDIASFDATAQASLTTALSSQLDCYEPDCLIKLLVKSASVSVTAVLTIPTPSGSESGSGSGSAAAAVAAAATSLVAQPLSALSSSLGVTVETVAPVQVRVEVVAIVVAPPPPSPPPPVTTPQAPPPLSPILGPNAAIIGSIIAGTIPMTVVVLLIIRSQWHMYKEKRAAEREGRDSRVLRHGSVSSVLYPTKV